MSAGRNRRVLITGVSGFLGLRLAKRLEADPQVGHLVGVDLEEPPVEIKGLEFIEVDIRNPRVARVLESTEVDTLVHTNITSSPSRLGGRSQMKENNVIGTLQLLAAAQRAERLTKVIMKSSSAVYGSSPREPSIIGEDHAARQVDLAGYGKDCAEAETYARDFGRRRRDVDLVVLRTQNVVGPTVNTNIKRYLSLPVVPTALGFDPRLQLLHEEDAVEAFYQSMVTDCRGIFNIAADGIVYLSKALRMLGRIQLPLPLPAAQFTANSLRRFGLVDFPLDQLKMILYGRVVSTRRAKETFGFAPRYTTEDALSDVRDEQGAVDEEQLSSRPAWERELLDYLKQMTTSDKETV
ncbi:MAG: NAD-dependent epimerase/dehydratase family protein [Actinomycetota bacterium]|nr:NAD-dependent epimerase/dehydratase family protein [Actinomycetota bacterium]